MSVLSGTAASPADPPQPGSRGYQYRWMVMAVVIAADVMDLLDATIANLAGPSIRADLGGGQSTLQWVLAAYTMSFAVGLVVSARAGDLVGRRRMFIIGIVGFTVASLLCGLAPSAGLLIAAAGMLWLGWRIGAADAVLSGWDLAPMFLVVGFGSGLIFAPLFDIILADLDDREVGTGSGVLNAVQQFGGALGVAVIGTLFFQWIPQDGWNHATRAVLWVAVGCSAVAFAVAFLLPRNAREDALH
jgi:MFS family permease